MWILYWFIHIGILLCVFMCEWNVFNKIHLWTSSGSLPVIIFLIFIYEHINARRNSYVNFFWRVQAYIHMCFNIIFICEYPLVFIHMWIRSHLLYSYVHIQLVNIHMWISADFLFTCEYRDDIMHMWIKYRWTCEYGICGGDNF